MTGCPHPGIVNVVEKAVELTGENVHLLVGGFHLGGSSKEEIENIVDRFKSLKVEKSPHAIAVGTPLDKC